MNRSIPAVGLALAMRSQVLGTNAVVIIGRRIFLRPYFPGIAKSPPPLQPAIFDHDRSRDSSEETESSPADHAQRPRRRRQHARTPQHPKRPFTPLAPRVVPDRPALSPWRRSTGRGCEAEPGRGSPPTGEHSPVRSPGPSQAGPGCGGCPEALGPRRGGVDVACRDHTDSV